MTRLTTYYDTLQVARSANDGVIRAAYRALSQKYHPDRHPDKLEWATKAMQRLNEAYVVLSDPDRRAAYDKQLSEYETARHQQTEREERERKARIEAETRAHAAELARLEQAKFQERERAARARKLRELAEERARAESLRQSPELGADVRAIEQKAAIDARGSTWHKKPLGWRSLLVCLALAGFAGSYFGIAGFGTAINGVVPGIAAGCAFWWWLRRKTGVPGYSAPRVLGRLWSKILVLLKMAIAAAIVVIILDIVINVERAQAPPPQTVSSPAPEKSYVDPTPTYSKTPPSRPQPALAESQAQYDATVSRLEQRYFEIDPDSPLYSQRKVDIVMALAQDYVRAGMSRSQALERAADEALNPYSRSQR